MYILDKRCVWPRTKKCRGWGAILLDIPRKHTVYPIYTPFSGGIYLMLAPHLTRYIKYLSKLVTSSFKTIHQQLTKANKNWKPYSGFRRLSEINLLSNERFFQRNLWNPRKRRSLEQLLNWVYIWKSNLLILTRK